jgi:hypothetical protein
MVSEHALERLGIYAPVVSEGAMEALALGLARNGRKADSVAVVVSLDQPVGDPTGRNWALCDRLVGVVRDCEVKTIMLSRESQINAPHLRVARIVHA